MQTVAHLALVRALNKVGSKRRLAERLRATPSRIDAWLTEKEFIPAEIFTRLADLLIEYDLEEQERMARTSKKKAGT